MPSPGQTKRCNKTSKGLWGFLVGFLKLPWTFYVHHIFCVPDWNFELSSLLLKKVHLWEGPPWWLSGKESACQCGRLRYHPWVGNIPCRRKWQSTQVFLPGKSHEPRSLVGCSPWGCERVGHSLATKYQSIHRLRVHLFSFHSVVTGKSDEGLFKSCRAFGFQWKRKLTLCHRSILHGEAVLG